MERYISRQQRRKLERDNKVHGRALHQIKRECWPTDDDEKRVEVWRSSTFLLQVFQEPGGVQRLSVNRTSIHVPTGDWEEGISWEELQRLKAECGRADLTAVEVYPAEIDEVNVANMRHLWVLPEKLSFMWKRGS